MNRPRAGLSVFADLRRLFTLLDMHWRRRFAVLAGFTLLGAVVELAVVGAIVPFLAIIADPQARRSGPIVRAVVEHIPRWDGQSVVASVATLFIVIALLAAVVRLLLARLTFWTMYAVGHEISVAIYARIVHQPYSFHIAHNSSDSVAVINRVVDITHNMILALIQSWSAAVIATFIVAGLFVVDPVVAGLTIVSFAIIYVVPSTLIRRRLLRNGAIIAAAAGARIQTVQEGVGGIRDVLLEHAQPVYIKRFSEIDAVYHSRARDNVFMGAAPRFIIESLGLVMIAVLALVMSGRPGGIGAALPVLGALAIGAQRMMPLLQLVYQSWAAIVSVRPSFDAVMSFALLPKGTDSPPIERLPFRRVIELDHVDFAYASGVKVLHQVSTTIARGERVAFVGQTGSGKSTLIDLVMGLLEPGGGSIAIDGVPLDPTNRRAWQENIAHVSQSIYLSDATVAENIAFGVDVAQINTHRLKDAARRAELLPFIESLPGGFETGVGERGVRLSGGQRQRIGIARALYKQCSVLVLDEATSALDERTEAAVMANLDTLDADLTVLIIAHRLSTVRRCDRIYRLDGGRIVASGSFEDVIGQADQDNPPAAMIG